FVEELTKTVLASGLMEEQEDRYALRGPLPPLAIPATLHDALLARLDRLAAAKVVAQLGATIGRTFTSDVVQAVAPLDAVTLEEALVQLVEAEIVAQRGAPTHRRQPVTSRSPRFAYVHKGWHSYMGKKRRAHYAAMRIAGRERI